MPIEGDARVLFHREGFDRPGKGLVPARCSPLALDIDGWDGSRRPLHHDNAEVVGGVPFGHADGDLHDVLPFRQSDRDLRPIP